MKFEDYVTARGPSLQRYAFLLTGDVHRAQDLVQTALMECLVRWRRVTNADHPDAYVRTIITHAHVNWCRKRSSGERPFDPHEYRDAGAGALEQDPAVRVSDHDELRRAMTVLSPHQRAVLVLRHYEGYDDQMIATVLNCSQATVRAHASRGLGRLRAVLTDAVAEPGLITSPPVEETT